MLKFFRDDTFRAAMLRKSPTPAYGTSGRTSTIRGAIRNGVRASDRSPTVCTFCLPVTTCSVISSGQPRTTIDFRKAIEARQIIIIKLPVTVPHISRLIGTILLAQIQTAVFSFGDIPESNRSGVSLYMDEFQKFATKDIEKLFTQGRKFGMRLTVAHQQRNQLPTFLQASTMTARTKICFQLTPEDGHEMAHVFPAAETTIRPEDMAEHPSRELLAHTPEVEGVEAFVELYLRPLQGHKRGAGGGN